MNSLEEDFLKKKIDISQYDHSLSAAVDAAGDCGGGKDGVVGGEDGVVGGGHSQASCDHEDGGNPPDVDTAGQKDADKSEKKIMEPG